MTRWSHESDPSAVYADTDPFTSPDGIQYPSGWPKAAILGMHPITETLDEAKTRIGAVVQGHIDAAAAARGYRNGDAMAGYITSIIPSWRDEAQAFVSWRDAVWVECFQVLGAVLEGAPVPTEDDVIAGLPVPVWG